MGCLFCVIFIYLFFLSGLLWGNDKGALIMSGRTLNQVM